jgi:hypothetical protein
MMADQYQNTMQDIHLYLYLALEMLPSDVTASYWFNKNR